MKTAIVVGAGPSGFMAAVKLAEKGYKVRLFERNKTIGKKLSLTGGGRCNITSSIPLDEFYAHITSNPKFLYSAFNSLDNISLMNFFEKANIRFKIENKKVYLYSDDSYELISCMTKMLESHRVEVIFNSFVSDIIMEDGIAKGIISQRRKFFADKIVLCTGGASYKSTGSDGALLSVLESYGISVNKLYPALVQIKFKEDVSVLMGISLADIILRSGEGKKTISQRGDIIFTQKGISGPAALNISSYLTDKNKIGSTLFIDFLPDRSYEEVKNIIMEKNNKSLPNKFKGLIPSELLKYIFNGYEQTDIFNLKKENLYSLTELIKNYGFTISSFGSIDESIVTKGGVDLKSVNPSTMESKVIKNLFFAGEILDIDASTGGFNLQIAFSTGYLAGSS